MSRDRLSVRGAAPDFFVTRCVVCRRIQWERLDGVCVKLQSVPAAVVPLAQLPNRTHAFHTPARIRSSRYGLNGSSLLSCACRGPYSGSALGCCRYFRMVLRSQPVSLLIPWMLIPCRCSSFSSCTSRPLSKSRNLLRAEWAPVYHARGWDFSTGTMRIFAPALTKRRNGFWNGRKCFRMRVVPTVGV
jgi:hypothetical protein